MAWSRIGGTNASGSSGASIGAAYTIGGVGRLIVCSVSWGSTTNTLNSVTDTLGNTYTVVAASYASDSGNTQVIQLAYCVTTSSGSTTITANFSGSDTSHAILIDEYNGSLGSIAYVTASAAAAFQSGLGSGTDVISSGSIGASSGHLQVGGTACTSLAPVVNVSAGTGFTGGAGNSSVVQMLAEFKTASGAGASLFSTTQTGANWVTAGMAFSEGGGGGGGTTNAIWLITA